MYWGLIGCSFVAFAGSTEFIPELNEHLRLVKFTSEFKMTMTMVMAFDYIGCWIIERGLKVAFSDFKPKDIAVRRPDQLKREQERKHKEWLEGERQKEIKAGKL